MPLKNYGVLRGQVLRGQREGADNSTPHYQIHLNDGTGDWRVAVNVRSAVWPSELLYLVVDDVAHPMLEQLAAAGPGWHELASAPAGVALDYIRANLFQREQMRVLPGTLAGGVNDLSSVLDAWVVRARDEPDASVFAFGERWGPEPTPDKVFGFSPGNGVHDIHMNQGNSAQYAADDGVWQDGGLLFHFPSGPRWVGVFLAFLSQAWHTDEGTGHRTDGGPSASAGDAAVRVVAAVVNAVGPAPEAESVTLLNASGDEIVLDGWSLADRSKQRTAIPTTRLAAGATIRVTVTPPFALGNNGGAVTLLDHDGLKVHGVAYTSADAQRDGWTVVF
jgi:uncharacterized protein YukJ